MQTVCSLVFLPQAAQPAGGSSANLTAGEGLVTLEVTLYACKDGASVPSPDCERQILETVLQPALGDTEAQRQLLATGMAVAVAVWGQCGSLTGAPRCACEHL